MKRKGRYFFWIILLGICIFFAGESFSNVEYVAQAKTAGQLSHNWKSAMATSINKKKIEMYVDGIDLRLRNGRIYMDESMSIMFPIDLVTETFNCSVNIYNENDITIEKGNTTLKMVMGEPKFSINGAIFKMSSAPLKKGNTLYVPLSALIKGFGYTYTWDIANNKATLINDDPTVRTLPYSYSYLSNGRKTTIRNQSVFSTCWAMASIVALETTLRPELEQELSVDHMTFQHSFKTNQYDGGEYSMALAYLLGWQGPVLEKDDPYGDRKSDNTLQPVVHVQEAQIIKSKDFQTIKEMVYKYGGVQSSLYTSMQSANGSSAYYNKKEAAYCYIGTEKPNHDVVIIGWDDNYPKENFNADIDTNGAFICQNSWGTDFGKDGIFYVSYADVNIGVHNLVYTGVESTDNYDKINQSDLCGWQGILGYDASKAYFANVYKPSNIELIKAVGFYATDVDTSYTVYLATNIGEGADFDNMTQIASGTFKNAGYYTVPLENSIEVYPGQRYAVIVKIDTPNSSRPVAVEMVKSYATLTVDLTDGEGYISYNGVSWENVEENYDCNVCLKVYTDIY